MPKFTHAEEAGAGGQVVGWVEISSEAGKPDHIAILGRVLALKPAAGRYTIEIKRHVRGNVLNNNQGGAFKVAKGENATLSRTAINVPLGSTIEIILKLYIEQQEVFSCVLVPSE
jgi:hypothetical protein